MPQLSESQIAEVRSEMVQTGQPCRFLFNGQALNITTGELCSKGCNIIYQIHYWNFHETTARKIAKWLGCKVDIEKE